MISGAPLSPNSEMPDEDSSFELDPSWLSSDPFYLDSLQHDPLTFVDADGSTLTRELDAAWGWMGAELPKLTVPTHAVHGSADPIAPIGAVRAYAAQIDALQLHEFAGTRHDVLNESMHRDVATSIIDFVAAHT